MTNPDKETAHLLRQLDNTGLLFDTAEYFSIPTTAFLIQLLEDAYTDKLDTSSTFWDDFGDYITRDTITVLREILAINSGRYNNLTTLRQAVQHVHETDERYAYATLKGLSTKSARQQFHTDYTQAEDQVRTQTAESLSEIDLDEPAPSIPEEKVQPKRKFLSTSFRKIELAEKLQAYELAKAEVYSLIRQVCRKGNEDLYTQIGRQFFEDHEEEFAFWFCTTRIENNQLPQREYPEWAPTIIKHLLNTNLDARSTMVLPALGPTDLASYDSSSEASLLK